MISANVGHVWHLKFDMWNLTMSRKNKHKHQSTWVAGTLRRWTEGNGQTSAKLQRNNNNSSSNNNDNNNRYHAKPSTTKVDSVEFSRFSAIFSQALSMTDLSCWVRVLLMTLARKKVTTQITKARKRQTKTEKDRKRQKKTEKDKKRQKEISKKPYWYKTLLNQPLFYCYRMLQPSDRCFTQAAPFAMHKMVAWVEIIWTDI